MEKCNDCRLRYVCMGPTEHACKSAGYTLYTPEAKAAGTGGSKKAEGSSSAESKAASTANAANENEQGSQPKASKAKPMRIGDLPFGVVLEITVKVALLATETAASLCKIADSYGVSRNELYESLVYGMRKAREEVSIEDLKIE